MTALRLLAACALVSIPVAAFAADAPHPAPLGPAEAMERIAASSKAATDRQADVAAAQLDTRAARSSLYPSVDLSGGFTDRDSPTIAVFGDLQAAMTDSAYWQGQLQARYLLWNGGLRSSSIAVARAREDETGAKGDVRVLAAQLEGMGRYLQALVAKAQQAAVAKRIEAVTAHLKVVQDLFGQGMVARNDVLETEVRLRTVKDRVFALQDQERAALRELNRAMGDAPDSPITLPDLLPPPPPLPQSHEELLQAATEHNPAVREAQARLATASKKEALQTHTGRPEVFAQAAHTYEENSHILHDNANLVFVGVSWNVFDGGARASERQRAGFETAKARRAVDEAQRQAENQADKAYREYNQALREAATARTNVAAAEENLRIEEDQYRAGLVKTTDVLDAEALLADSRLDLITRHYSAYLKQAEVLAVTGTNLVEFYRMLGSAEPKGDGS